MEAILKAEKESHNRWVGETLYLYPDLNPYADSPEQRIQIRIVLDKEYNIRLLQAVPDFSEARCVIGLDAFPTESKWRANTMPSLQFDRILSSREEQLWRQHERNLKIIQVGSNKNTWTVSGFNQQEVTSLCSELQCQFVEDFRSGVTSKRFADDLQDSMEAAGVENPRTIHYGLEKSVDEFATEAVVLVVGCISPSSDSIKDWLALLGNDATPKREVRSDYEGQEWVGPDAHVAHELLRDVRNKHVLQAIGRYARRPADG